MGSGTSRREEEVVVDDYHHTLSNNMGKLEIAGVGEISSATAIIDTANQTINDVRIESAYEFNKALMEIAQMNAKELYEKTATKKGRTTAVGFDSVGTPQVIAIFMRILGVHGAINLIDDYNDAELRRAVMLYGIDDVPAEKLKQVIRSVVEDAMTRETYLPIWLLASEEFLTQEARIRHKDAYKKRMQTANKKRQNMAEYHNRFMEQQQQQQHELPEGPRRFVAEEDEDTDDEDEEDPENIVIMKKEADTSNTTRSSSNNMGRLHIKGVGEINTAAAVIDTADQSINGIRIDDVEEFNRAVLSIAEDQAGAKRKRSEAAKKAAETRKRNKEDKEKEEEDKPIIESTINNTTSRVIFKGAPAIMKHVPSSYLPFHQIESRHLPNVYQIQGNYVIMELLDPFVFDEKQVKTYFDALKEVYRLTKFIDMDLSPSNTMMRKSDGAIVFIDLWTSGSTGYYWTPRSEEDPLPGLMTSLALVLLDFQYEKEAKQWRWDMLDEIKKEFPTASDAFKFADVDHGIYEHAKGAEFADTGGFYVLRAVYLAHKRIVKLQDYMKQKNKTFKEMTWTVTGFEDKEYAEYYRKAKEETRYLMTSDFLRAFFAHIKVKPEENEVVKQLKINNINDFVAVKEELLFEEEVAISGFLEFKPMNMSNSALFFPSTLRKILVMKKGEDVELTFSFDPEGRLFKDTYMSAFDWDPRFLGEKATVEKQLEGLAKVVDGKVVTKRTVPYSVWEANEGRWQSLIRKFSTSYHGKTFEEVKAKNKRAFQK